jgi:hypothetical protein
MRILNTGTADFWRSRIGEQLRWLRLTDSRYHRAQRPVVALVERLARAMLAQCRRLGQWPSVGVRGGTVSFEWRGRGELAVPLDGTRISYTPDPIRESGIVGMVLPLGSPQLVEKFLHHCLWHVLEAHP